MIFWAVLGFGLFLLLVALGIPRLAFTITLLVLLAQSGWLSYFKPSAAASLDEALAMILTVIFALIAIAGGIAFDIDDYKNREW